MFFRDCQSSRLDATAVKEKNVPVHAFCFFYIFIATQSSTWCAPPMTTRNTNCNTPESHKRFEEGYPDSPTTDPPDPHSICLLRSRLMLELTQSTYYREARIRSISSADLERLLALYQRRCCRSNTGHEDWKVYHNLVELSQSASS